MRGAGSCLESRRDDPASSGDEIRSLVTGIFGEVVCGIVVHNAREIGESSGQSTRVVNIVGEKVGT